MEEMLQKVGSTELPYAPLSLVMPQFYAYIQNFSGNWPQETLFTEVWVG